MGSGTTRKTCPQCRRRTMGAASKGGAYCCKCGWGLSERTAWTLLPTEHGLRPGTPKAIALLRQQGFEGVPPEPKPAPVLASDTDPLDRLEEIGAMVPPLYAPRSSLADGFGVWTQSQLQEPEATVSPDPEVSGWETDRGHPGYALPASVAEGIAAMRNAWPHLVAVVRAIELDHDQSIGPEEAAEGVKPWWKLPATRAALDTLRDHLSKGER